MGRQRFAAIAAQLEEDISWRARITAGKRPIGHSKSRRRAL